MSDTLIWKSKKLEKHPFTVIELSGQLDSDLTMQPVNAIAHPPEAENVAILMDSVTYLNSRGVSLLMLLHQKLEDRGHHLYIVNPVGPIRKVLDQSGASTLLNVRDSLDEVLHAD
ncbi:STAS domain-containing protein [Planctomycetota bacterium]